MKRHTRYLILFAAVLTALSLTLAACGGQASDTAAADDADLKLGQQLFQANCSSCHSTQKGTVLVGPSLGGVANRAGNVVDGMSAEAYIRQSINEPGAYLNEGFQNLMPDSYDQILSEEELDALVAYLMTLE